MKLKYQLPQNVSSFQIATQAWKVLGQMTRKVEESMTLVLSIYGKRNVQLKNLLLRKKTLRPTLLINFQKLQTTILWARIKTVSLLLHEKHFFGVIAQFTEKLVWKGTNIQKFASNDFCNMDNCLECAKLSRHVVHIAMISNLTLCQFSLLRL